MVKRARGQRIVGQRLKLTDAARRLGWHVETLRLRIRDGRLKAIRGPHGAYYVSPDDLAAVARPREQPARRQPTQEEMEASWDQLERYLERNRSALVRELKLFRDVRAHPSHHRRLYHLIAVDRLEELGISVDEIAAKVDISARQVRRLAQRRPLDALRRDLQTIRGRRHTQLVARRLVDQLRAQLEAQGFRFHRLPLQVASRRSFSRFRPIDPDQLPPAHKVKGLTPEEVRALRRAGLTEEQIEAVSLVGMGADEVNELIVRSIGRRARQTARHHF